MNDRSIDITDTSKIVQGIDDIKQSWYIILNTIKGSDPMRPNFGSGMFEYLDKPINIILTDLYLDIITSLEKFEPRAKITKVSLSNQNEIVNIVIEGVYTQTGDIITSTIDVTNLELRKKMLKSYNKSYNYSYE